MAHTWGCCLPCGWQWFLRIEPAVRLEEDSQNLASIPLNRQQRWFFGSYVVWRFVGQPAIYGEQFIRSRLAEEEAAIAANK